MPRWTAAVLALTLTACNSDWMQQRERMEQANSVLPVNYKADIAAFMRTYLNDPTGVRNAFVSAPAERTLEEIKRYTVCVRYMARKSNGQYAPSKDSLILFREGRLDRMVDNGREACKDAAYQPFPELEHLSR